VNFGTEFVPTFDQKLSFSPQQTPRNPTVAIDMFGSDNSDKTAVINPFFNNTSSSQNIPVVPTTTQATTEQKPPVINPFLNNNSATAPTSTQSYNVAPTPAPVLNMEEKMNQVYSYLEKGDFATATTCVVEAFNFMSKRNNMKLT
jgi:hypothetical protein